MFKRFWKLITLTITIWSDANASRMSAALTYFTMLSLAPTLMIAVAIAGYVYDNQLAEAEIIDQVSRVTTPEIAKTVAGLIKNAVKPGTGLIAGAVSLSILVFAASGVFTQLYDTFNDIWDVSLVGKGILFTIQKRLIGVGMVLIVGLLLIAALVLDSTMAFLTELVSGSYPRTERWLSLIDRSLSFLLMPVGFGMIFWFFPSTKIEWRDVWPAAILTSCMVAASRNLIGLYLRFSTTSEVYGVSSSLVVLLIWVYMTGLVVFFGASFSHAWAQVYGSRSEFAKKQKPEDAENSGDEESNDENLSDRPEHLEVKKRGESQNKIAAGLAESNEAESKPVPPVVPQRRV